MFGSDQCCWLGCCCGVGVEPPLDRAALVPRWHAPVAAQQVAESGVDAAFDLVGCRGDLQGCEFGCQVGEQVVLLGELG